MDDPWADDAGDIGAAASPRASVERTSGEGRVVTRGEVEEGGDKGSGEEPVDRPGEAENDGLAAGEAEAEEEKEGEAAASAPSPALRIDDLAIAETATETAAPDAAAPTDPFTPALASDTPDADADFDDFDDFDAPQASFDDDGFGDFGEFAEGDEAVEAAPPQVERQWSALSLRPVPARRELQQRLEDVLAPLVPSDEGFNDNPPRAVGGLAQVLTNESSREAYAQLTTAPILKPLDWTRSRVRREHLIAMGVPVNLDEVDSHRLTALPPLQIRTGLNSGRTSHDSRRQTMPAHSKKPSASAPVSAAPRSSGSDKYGLGARPEFDVPTAERLCGVEDDQLSLMSVDKLRKMQDELVATTADASAQLAWLLQLKDALGHDSATYNGMISELIANAAKAKQPSSGMFSGRKSRPASMSATHTPRRVASPSVAS